MGPNDQVGRICGLKGRIVFLNARIPCAFIEAPDTSQVYGVTDMDTIARLRQRGNKRLVKFDVIQFKECRVAVNIELYEEEQYLTDATLTPQERDVIRAPAEQRAPQISHSSAPSSVSSGTTVTTATSGSLYRASFGNNHAEEDSGTPGIQMPPPRPPVLAPLRGILRRPSESRPAEPAQHRPVSLPMSSPSIRPRETVLPPVAHHTVQFPSSAAIDQFRTISLSEIQDRSSVFDVQGYRNITPPGHPTATARNVSGYGAAVPEPLPLRTGEVVNRPGGASRSSTMSLVAPIELTNERSRSVFEDMGSRHRPIPEDNNYRFNTTKTVTDPPRASSERHDQLQPVQEVQEIAVERLEPTRIGMGEPDDDERELHRTLNEWYYIPSKFNRDDYPFPCGGFVVQSSGPDNTIMVFTRRLGCIVRPEDPHRNGRPYAYFMVIGPDNYQAWEYDEYQPPSFKSTKFVNSTEIEMKGFALMAPGRRDDPESEWYAWNDHTGFMRCQSSCGRILKKKYKDWEPTGQMVMFDATSIDNGGIWTIKNLSYIDYQFAHKNKVWPTQAYYIDGLRVLEKQYQRNPREEMAFYCEQLGGEVFAKLSHICCKPRDEQLYHIRFGAVIITRWGRTGRGRRFQCLMCAPEVAWNDPSRPHFIELSRKLAVSDWDATMNEAVLAANAAATAPASSTQQTRSTGNPKPFKLQVRKDPVPWEDEW